MITSIKDINLDELKKNFVRLYYFGLGFIQLKLNDVERLHFYSPKLPAITEDIHNHRYGFISRVLKGEITNHVYDVRRVTADSFDTAHDHVIVNETCNPEIKAPKEELPCNIWSERTETYHLGQAYVMSPDMFHRVEARDCVTYLMRTHHTAEHAQIVLPKGKESVCPFSKKIPEEELWSIMHEMVNS